MKEESKHKILLSFGIENENDILSLSDNQLVKCYSLYNAPNSLDALRYYDECNDEEKSLFAKIIRFCISNDKILLFARINKEGVMSEQNSDILNETRSALHNYRFFIKENNDLSYIINEDVEMRTNILVDKIMKS